MELYINGIQMEVNKDFELAMSFSFADVANPFKQKTDFSKSFVLPASENNVRALVVDFNTAFGTATPEAEVFAGGVRLLKGHAHITNVKYIGTDPLSITIALFGDRLTLFNVMENKTIIDPSMRWDDYTHKTTFQHFSNNALLHEAYYLGNIQTIPFSDPSRPYAIRGYRYPMVNYDLQDTTPRNWDIKDQYPYPYLREMIERIVWSNGYFLNPGGFFQDAGDRTDINSILYINPSIIEEENEDYSLVTASDSLATTTPFDYLADVNNSFQDDIDFQLSTNIDPAAGTAYVIPGAYLQPQVGSPGVAFNANVYLKGDVILTTNVTHEPKTYDIDLQLDITLRVIRVGDGAIVSESNPVAIGGFVTRNDNLQPTPFDISVPITPTQEVSLPPFYANDGDQFKLAYHITKYNVMIKLQGEIGWTDFTYEYTGIIDTMPEGYWEISRSLGVGAYIGDALQRDVMEGFMNHYNVVMVCDEQNKTVDLIPYDDYFTYDLEDTTPLDQYIDRRSVSIDPDALRNQTGRFEAKYEVGAGYLNDLYNKRFGEPYGSKVVNVFDPWNRQTHEETSFFQSAPLSERVIDNGGNLYPFIFPTLDDDEQTAGTAGVTKSGKPFLGYWWVLVNQPIGGDVVTDYCLIMKDELGVNQNMINVNNKAWWSYAAHLQINSYVNKGNAENDVNFGVAKELYLSQGLDVYSNKNTFNRFFTNRMWTYLSTESQVCEVELFMEPAQLEQLILNNRGGVFSFYGRAWWLMELSDYFVNTTRGVKAKFISHHEDKRFTMYTDYPFTGQSGQYFPTGFELTLNQGGTGDATPIKNAQ